MCAAVMHPAPTVICPMLYSYLVVSLSECVSCVESSMLLSLRSGAWTDQIAPGQACMPHVEALCICLVLAGGSHRQDEIASDIRLS